MELSAFANARNRPIEKTPVWLTSPPIKVRSGQIVRISGSIRIDNPIRQSEDGAMIIDSLGGYDLAARFSKTNDWEKFTLYRSAASDGYLQITLALTGTGKVYFDEMEVLISTPATPTYNFDKNTAENKKIER